MFILFSRRNSEKSCICFDVETNNADNPTASAFTSLILLTILGIGTCFPKSKTSYPLLTNIVFTKFFPISCTSPYTVHRTIFPLLIPSCFMRYFSSSKTAAFMHSADFKTKGKINSPAPNLSPTSFIAGRSTSLRVSTAASCNFSLLPESVVLFVSFSNNTSEIEKSSLDAILSDIDKTTSFSIPSFNRLTILK